LGYNQDKAESRSRKRSRWSAVVPAESGRGPSQAQSRASGSLNGRWRARLSCACGAAAGREAGSAVAPGARPPTWPRRAVHGHNFGDGHPGCRMTGKRAGHPARPRSSSPEPPRRVLPDSRSYLATPYRRRSGQSYQESRSRSKACGTGPFARPAPGAGVPPVWRLPRIVLPAQG
jgi:hypothetical protein